MMSQTEIFGHLGIGTRSDVADAWNHQHVPLWSERSICRNQQIFV